MATSPGPSNGPRSQAKEELGSARAPREGQWPATAGDTQPQADAAAARDDGLSRRRFLTRASIGVAATAALVAGIPGAPRLAAAAIEPAAPEPPGSVEPPGEDIVAHVRSTSTGELAVLMGTREVVYRDPALVRRLLAAARRSNGKA